MAQSVNGEVTEPVSIILLPASNSNRPGVESDPVALFGVLLVTSGHHAPVALWE